MKNLMNLKGSTVSRHLALLVLSACGMTALSGSYNVTQQGGQFMQNPACSQIMLSISQSGNQITGQGQNQCFTETIQGTTTSNGQANVTLMVYSGGSGQTNWMNYPGNTYYPNNNYYPTNNYYPNNTYQNAGGMGCTYQGLLTISGNTIAGSLTPTGNCVGQGSITLNGTRN